MSLSLGATFGRPGRGVLTAVAKGVRYRDVVQRLLVGALALAAVAAPLECFLYIRAYGVNVLFWDEWSFLPPLVERMYAGTLTFYDLFKQHNDHRISFPLLVMLGVGYLTGLNTVAIMYATWVALCLAAVMLYLVCRRLIPSTSLALALFVPVAWLVFSPRQVESLLRGDGIAAVLAAVAALGAIFFLSRARTLDWAFLAAVGCAIVTSFSWGIGLAIWPTGVFQALVIRRASAAGGEAIAWKALAVWCAIAAVTYAAYYVDYVRPPYGSYGPTLAQLRDRPESILSYFFVTVGAPLAVEPWAAQAIGVLLVPVYVGVLVAALVRPKIMTRTTTAPLGMAAFALASFALVVAGRAGLGPEQALASRYTTISGLGVVSLYLFAVAFAVARCRPPARGASHLAAFLLALIGLGLVTSYTWGEKEGVRWRTEREAMAYHVATYGLQSDPTLARVGMDPTSVRRSSAYFEANGLSVFSGPRVDPTSLRRASGSPLHSLDSFNGHPIPPDRVVVVEATGVDTIPIVGWAVDKNAGRAAGGVFVVIDDRVHLTTMYGQERGWVVEQQGNPAYRFSGFAASLAPRALERGRHSVRLKVVSADRTRYYQSEPFTLEIR